MKPSGNFHHPYFPASRDAEVVGAILDVEGELDYSVNHTGDSGPYRFEYEFSN